MRLYLVAYQPHDAEFVGAAIVVAFDEFKAREAAEEHSLVWGTGRRDVGGRSARRADRPEAVPSRRSKANEERPKEAAGPVGLNVQNRGQASMTSQSRTVYIAGIALAVAVVLLLIQSRELIWTFWIWLWN
jgi:hypothetical protein